MKTYDLVLVGGGIVGVSTALQLKRRNPDAAILLIEKEAFLAQHQTGHNSGVVHAGVYYQPGSLKADFCKRGAAQTIEFCREHGLPFKQIGKLLVATDAIEYERMEALEGRCSQNGIETQRLSERELTGIEPAVVGVGALLVSATGITDFKIITAKMAELFMALGGEIKCGLEVKALRERAHTVHIELAGTTVTAKYLVLCGGLMADRLARNMGISAGSCCRSPSMARMYSPDAWSNPAASADVWPKFRRSLISITRESTAAISSSMRQVRSREPSSTKTSSKLEPTCSMTPFTRS